MLILPSLHYFFFRWSLFGFGFWECLMRRRIGRIGSKWAILCFGIFLDRGVLCYFPWDWQLSLACLVLGLYSM